MSFSGACNLYLRGRVSLAEYEQILESTFRLQCKADTNTDNIVLKIIASATAAIPFLMAGLCINFVHVFGTIVTSRPKITTSETPNSNNYIFGVILHLGESSQYQIGVYFTEFEAKH